MGYKKLSITIEKLINTLNNEESLYFSKTKLKKLTNIQIHYIDLIYHEKNPTQSEMAKILKVSKPSVTNTIDRLEKLGYVKKVQSDNDRRIHHLHLTNRGVEIAQIHDSFHEVFTEKLVSKLNKDEIKILNELLNKALDK